MTRLIFARWYPYVLPLRSPLKTASHTWHERRGVVITLQDEDGAVGYGEAAPFLTTESWAETVAQVGTVLSQWVGRTLPDLAELPSWLVGCDHTPATRHGLELALLNLLAQRAEVSLAALVAGSEGTVASRVAVNRLVGGGTVAETLARVQQGFEEGDRCFKLKVGHDFAQDRQRVRGTRDWLGERGELRLDANGAWTLTEAIAHCAELSPWGIEYIEQPVATGEDLAEVRWRSAVPVAADELVTSLTALKSLLSWGAADIYVLKPMQLGGLLVAREAATEILKQGLSVVITTAIDGAIARHGAIHLAATLPAIHAHGLGTGSLLAEDLSYPCPQVHRGFIALEPSC
ncbi:MAG: o-succinylbenzoate synthase [Oscillatoriales cyanobacterium SM2_2_1]|nr:o-succinylbenzoate synthase [Oscillatoriales cyanobacterium SM2_2_1]